MSSNQGESQSDGAKIHTDYESSAFSSPNIKSEAQNLTPAPEVENTQKQPTTDGIPIAEQDIIFHAQDIRRPDSIKLFTHVEGAEARERQRQRKLEHQRAVSLAEEQAKRKANQKQQDRAKRRALHEQKISDRQTKHQALLARHAERRAKLQNSKFYKLCLKGFRKYITIAVVLLLVIGLPVTIYFSFIRPANLRAEQQRLQQEDESASSSAIGFRDEISSNISTYSPETLSYVQENFQEKISSTTSQAEKFYLYISYAEEVWSLSDNSQLAVDILKNQDASPVNQNQKITYYACMLKYYTELSNQSEVAKYEQLINGIIPEEQDMEENNQ